MTKRYPLPLRRIVPATALTIAAIGAGFSSGAEDRKSDAPVACSLDVSAGAFGQTFEGTVQARRDVSGTYELRIEKSGRSGSATIHQSGPFDLADGDTEVVGEATLSGRRSEFDAQLTLEVDGQRYRCGDRNLPQDI